MHVGTFSIIAMSPDSRSIGIATASGSTFVGDRVPHAKPGVGAVATQAYTNIIYGVRGLELMKFGLTPQEALDSLLREDIARDLRQVAIMDFKGRKAAFTGSKVPEYHAEIVRGDYIVIGNMLSSRAIVKGIAETFESTVGDLAFRLASALKAGSKGGGDKRGEKSAALIVVNDKTVKVKVKVDIHENPIEELLRQLNGGNNV